MVSGEWSLLTTHHWFCPLPARRNPVTIPPQHPPNRPSMLHERTTMNVENTAPTRRDALKTSGGIAIASTLAGIGMSGLYAGESNTINIALVGCGGRGTGAAINALSTQQGPVQIVAMADAY